MQDFNKIKSIFENLAKSSQELTARLQDAYKVDPDLPKHVFKDLAVPGLGNRLSFNEFNKHYENSGIYLTIDLNGFDSINEKSGFESGNEAIKKFGEELANLSKHCGVKAFRLSGDHFLVHLPNQEVADKFSKEVMGLVDSLPMVDGTHKMSVSMGLGYDLEHAMKAHSHAKNKLSQNVNGIIQRSNQPGREQNSLHSLLHDSPSSEWSSLLGYDNLAPHEEVEPLIDKDIKSPFKSYKG